jgi:hypothetical protein
MTLTILKACEGDYLLTEAYHVMHIGGMLMIMKSNDGTS